MLWTADLDWLDKINFIPNITLLFCASVLASSFTFYLAILTIKFNDINWKIHFSLDLAAVDFNIVM